MPNRRHLPVPLPTSTAVAAAIQANQPSNMVYLRTKYWFGDLYTAEDPVLLEHLGPTMNGYRGHAHQHVLGVRVRARGVEMGDPTMIETDDITVGGYINYARRHTHAELSLGYRRKLALAAPLDHQAGG